MSSDFTYHSSEKPSRETWAAVKRIAQRVALQHLALIETGCKRPRVMDEVPRLRHDLRGYQYERHDEKDTLLIFTQFFLALAHDNPDSKAKPEIVMSAVYRMRYSVKNLADASEEEVEAFTRINACHNAWPYWREFVHSVAGRMGLGHITLPSLINELEHAKAADPEAQAALTEGSASED